MRPKIDVVFSDIKNGEIAKIGVQKIRLSKSRRRMEVLLDGDAAHDALMKFESDLKAYYHLNHAKVKDRSAIKKEELEKMKQRMALANSDEESGNYETSHLKSNTIVRDLGKAQVEEMLYGTAIREDLVPI